MLDTSVITIDSIVGYYIAAVQKINKLFKCNGLISKRDHPTLGLSLNVVY
jgi:hypothetical protein